MPCTTILVGKNASYDGSTMISRNDDGSFEAKKVITVTPDKQPRKYRSVIAHLEIELPEDPISYTSAPSVSKKNGIWPACGINEMNVGMTATETITTNPRVMGADPMVEYQPASRGKKKVPGGIGEEDLVVLVLPYIKTAREGVERLGMLLEKYGTYESNGIAFNDENEVWWMETIGGHHWIARRVPDDRVVIMPNQFGLDNFDFDDAFGEKKEHLCSADLKRFVEENHLALDQEASFDPRLAFGSHADSDHIYNTPRAWYMARYFMPTAFVWNGENADFTPESDDLPWSLVPERKVTPEDIKYLLSSHYQGTPYDPYDSSSVKHGKYRVIGVPNSDVSILLQIRGYMPDALKGVEWVSMGGSGYTAMVPLYARGGKMPDYFSATPEEVTTGYCYWDSRLIAMMTDAYHSTGLILDERYQNKVFNLGRRILHDMDEKYLQEKELPVLSEANKQIALMLKKESAAVIAKLLGNAGEHMKTRYHRGDN